MTGHGDATASNDSLTVTAELRTVNHRHFKLSVRGLDGSAALESRVESMLRTVINRGVASVTFRLERSTAADAQAIQPGVIQAYQRQLAAAFGTNVAESVPMATWLTLPGVFREPLITMELTSAEWEVVERALQTALDRLQRMRIAEGEAMARDLQVHCRAIADAAQLVSTRSPAVVTSYQQRLAERVQRLIAGQELSVTESEIAREVAIFADRCDISEELVRLASHLDQFHACLEEATSSGRKMDFLIQEMFREANTIGSKANDAEITRSVVEIKNRIEKMREMVQNVE